MRIRLYLILFLSISVPNILWAQDEKPAIPKYMVSESSCSLFLNWVYRDLTIQNLDKSFERVQNKVVLSMLTALKNSSYKDFKKNPALVSLIESMSQVDNNLDLYIGKKKQYSLYKMFNKKKLKNIPKSKFNQIVKEWSKLQTSSPYLFIGLSDDQKFDDWDQTTVEILDQVADLTMHDLDLEKKLNHVKLDYLSPNQDFKVKSKEIGIAKGINEAKKSLAKSNKSLNHFSKKLYLSHLDEFVDFCSESIAQKLYANNKVICPFKPNSVDPSVELKLQLRAITEALSPHGFVRYSNSIIKPLRVLAPTPIPVDDIILEPMEPIQVYMPLVIKKIDYSTSPVKGATHCKRDANAASMIVIHHTATGKDKSPDQINSDHLENSTEGDPWFMIGYNYLISETYDGASTINPSVIQGRPDDMTGGHAGGYTKELTDKEKKHLKKYKIKCGPGKTENDYSKPRTIYPLRDSGIINGNIVSIGISIIGDYERKHRVSIGGVVTFSNYKNNPVVFPSDTVLRRTAELSCNLQKKYPNITRIVPHSYFKATNCPGSVIGKLEKIRQIANDKYGCHFGKPELRR